MLQRLDNPNATEAALIAAAGRMARTPARSRALAAFERQGLPTRRVEEWHYTDLRSRLKLSVSPAGATMAGPPVAGAAIRVVDGRLEEAAMPPLPAGVKRVPFAGHDSDATVAVIAAMLAGEGLALAIAAGGKAATPILIRHEATGAAPFGAQIEVAIGAGAEATIVEQLTGHAPLAAVRTRLRVADGARAVWAIFQENDANSSVLARLEIELGADAELTILAFNRASALVRREIAVAAAGANSRIVMRGVNLIGAAGHVDLTTDIGHSAPGVAASEIFRNVVTGDGQGAFQGRIRVAAQAQKTDARMACNTLLLSDEAEFSAKPELEIFADDVQCGHGATVADILPEHLFYLRARGIPEREARAMLVKGFVEDTFGEVADESLREAFNARIEDWLDRHG